MLMELTAVNSENFRFSLKEEKIFTIEKIN